jgi:RND family efflux transporter MFP subunit
MMTRSMTLVVMMVLTGWACDGDTPAPAKADPPAKVANPVGEASLTSITLSDEAVKRLGITTATSAVEAVSRSRTAGGEVIVPPGGAVTVTAPVSGTLQAGGGGVPAVGSQVTRGQAIFSLYPIEPADRDVHLEADRTAASAEAELVLATQRLQRLERLLADGAASQRSVEEARAQQKVAEANAKAAKSRAQDLDSSPTGTGGGLVVRAPIAGVLQAVTAAPGQTVAASAPLFQVAQSDGLWVKVPLFVGERAMVDRSKPAEVASLGETQGPTIPAAPVSGPPSADPTTATTDLFYVLGNRSSVRPGERVSVRLPLSGAEQGLVVPTASILYDLNGGSWVYEATGPNTFVRRRVEIRSQLGGKTLLARGLDPGKKVVVDGAAELFGTEFGAGK